MKIVVENNIVLDALLGRYPYNEPAEKILIACAETHRGYLTANSLTDIFYILRKFMDVQSAKAAIIRLIGLFQIISINEEDCINAIELPIDDFEDALVLTCSKKAEADYIVTRDVNFLSVKSNVPVVPPDELMNIL